MVKLNKLNELNKPDPRFHGGRLKELFSSFLFYLSILFFIIGFNFSDNRAGGWTQQFMPNLNGASIKDITFTDSLNGYAVTSLRSSNDSAYILKTTNGGDNWNVKFMHDKAFVRIQFINGNTGFTNAFTKIFKTTNVGENWSVVNLPNIFGDDMFVLNQDTIWLAMSETFTGGVYRTTNGGGSWDRQLDLGSQNPVKVYFFDGRIGYIAKNTGSAYIRKTTNSGLNWDTIVNGRGFSDIFFIDSLTGWVAFDSVRKTTNGGINWQTQILPYGGYIYSFSQLIQFAKINADTIWGVGGRINFPNFQTRGIIYKTTNGGNTWGFQLPDTSINIFLYNQNKFVNKFIGWAYGGPTGVHTTTGGDTTLMGIKQISTEIPKEYKLFQNFPNPFNPTTTIRFQIARIVKGEKSNVKIAVYDIQGREIEILADGDFKAGSYEISFNGLKYSSGVYFYSMYVDGTLADTKKINIIK